MRELWPHQAQGIQMLRQSLSTGHRRPMLQSPTGSGKTRIAAAIVEGALRKDKRVVFITPAISLIDQTVKAFYDEGISDVGVIQANHPMTNWSRPAQIASVQTLAKRARPQADLFLIDEAHIVHKTHSDLLTNEDLKGVPMIGLSATPWRRGLGKLYDDLLIVATTSQLIERGLLSPFRVFASSHPDLSEVRTLAGDYHEGDLGGAMNKVQLVADVVDNWMRHGGGRPTLCFGVDRAHAKSLQNRFLAAGVPAGYIDCNLDGEDREPILAQFRRGEIKVICNVATMTTGVDLDVRCLILARPTKSESLFVQIIGRALRTASGKDHALIFDHSDTHLRLGFVTDIHHEKLDDGRGASASDRKDMPLPLPKECPKCSFLKPAKLPQCPACGFKTEKQTDVEHQDGELFEITGKRFVKKGSETYEDKVNFYCMLKHHAKANAYSDGWISHKFKEKYGEWPPDRYRGLAAEPPNAAVLSWIKSRQIAFAKAKAKAKSSNATAAA